MEQKLSFPIICLTLLLCSLPTESQILMSVYPPQVVLGSSSPVSTTFRCTISGNSNILGIFTMQLLRKRKTDLDFVMVGQVSVTDPNPAFVTTAPQDIVSRGSMSGGIDVNTPTSSTLTLTLSTQGLVCTDKGEYQCRMVYQDAYARPIVVQNNGTLSIYESEIQMSINPQEIVLGSSSPVSTTFTCTIPGGANIEMIFAMLILRKRETDMDFVVVGEVHDPANPAFVPTAPQDIVSRGSMSGGIDVNTPTSSTLTLTLSTQGLVCTDKGEYQCRMVYQDATSRLLTVLSNGTLSIYESEIQMSIIPQEIVLGSSSPVSTTFTCTISGSANIRRIFVMQILRKRESDMDFVVVGEVHDPANPAFVPTAPQDIVSRGSMSGGIDVNTPTSSTLTLTLSTQDLVCTDKGEYQCRMVYQDAYARPIVVQNNGTLSICDQEPTTTERAETLTNVTNKGEESGVDVVIG